MRKKKCWLCWLELEPPHPTDLFPNNQQEKKTRNKQEQFSHSSTQREDERVGHIVLPHLNRTFDSLNVFFDLAKEMVDPMEQQGVLPGLCQVCCSLAEQPSPWLAGDLRLGGWFD